MQTLNYIFRKLEVEIRKALPMREIIAIVGARQSGKTTLMRRIADSLDPEKVCFLDFEDRDDLALFTSDIKAFAELNVKGFEYLFIDEFQYAKEGGKNLKYLYDRFSIKILISGSSASELTVQSIRYLVGRIFVFTLYPLSFEEYLTWKEPALARIIHETVTPGSEIIKRVNIQYEEFLIYGGYPRIALADSPDEKKLVLKNIVNTYLLREIKQILNYRDDYKLTKLIHALALQVGGTGNYNELGTLTGFAYKDLLAALNVLQKTFVIAESRPFFTNKRIELVKAPKFYFVDTGFRNHIIKNFQDTTNRTDTGMLNENFISQELIKHDIPLHYWRTKSGAEVDFILEGEGKLLPVEVKTQLTKPGITRSFRSFIQKYNPAKGVISSLELASEEELAGIPVQFLPHGLFSFHVKDLI